MEGYIERVKVYFGNDQSRLKIPHFFLGKSGWEW